MSVELLLWLAVGALFVACVGVERRDLIDEERAREILEAVGCDVPDEVPTACVLAHAYDEAEPPMTECGGVRCPK